MSPPWQRVPLPQLLVSLLASLAPLVDGSAELTRHADALPVAANLATSVTNPVYYAGSMEWCDLGTGLRSLRVWPDGDEGQAVSLNITHGDPVWFKWKAPVSSVRWVCDGMTDPQITRLDKQVSSWSVQSTIEQKGWIVRKASGRLSFVGWMEAAYNTSVVYMAGEGGYTCTAKIPVLLRTASGALLALAEARRESCADFASTDLVAKRSEDGGRTWSRLRALRSESGPGVPRTVIGNAAPVQLSASSRHHPGRILLPHCRNNSEVWLMHSDDDGHTWSKPRRLEGMTLAGWKWVATGPPGSIQLRSGRVVVPSYHGDFRAGLINNIVHGHVMLSDDGGDTWRLSAAGNFSGSAAKDLNENQAVQLRNGSVLLNGRSLATFSEQARLQMRSDDGGETWRPARYVGLPQPINGCEGSMVSTGRGDPPVLLYSGVDAYAFRVRMQLWASMDEGATWEKYKAIESGPSGYSSLQMDCDGAGASTCDALLLYETSDLAHDIPVMNPQRQIFRRVPFVLPGRPSPTGRARAPKGAAAPAPEQSLVV